MPWIMRVIKREMPNVGKMNSENFIHLQTIEKLITIDVTHL